MMNPDDMIDMSGGNGSRRHRIFRALVAMAIAASLWSVTVFAIVASDAEIFQKNIRYLPTCYLDKQTVPDGIRFTVRSIGGELSWSRVTIELMNQDTSDYATWDNASESQLTDYAGVTQNLGEATLGTVSFTCIVIDVAGNGILSNGDSITITGELSYNIEYRFSLICEPPGGGKIASSDFWG